MNKNKFIEFYEEEGLKTDRYANKDFWKRRYHQKRSIMVKKIICSIMKENHSFLDVGCGTGEYIKMVQKTGNLLIGIDVSTSYLARTRLETSGSVNLIRADAMSLPFKDRSIDIITCSEVIEHLQEPKRAIDEIFRVATKKVILTTPNNSIRRIIFKTLLGTDELKKRSTKVGHINIFPIDYLVLLIDNKKWKVIEKRTQYNLMPPQSIVLPTILSHLFTIVEKFLTIFFPKFGDTSILIYETIGD